MMYNVSWTNGTDTTNHGTYATWKDAYESIRAWWELNNFEPRYVRINGGDGYDKSMIDYGSWTCFYYITKEN